MVRSLRLARDRDTVLNQQTEKQNQEDKKQTNNLPHKPNTNHQTKHIPMFINDLILYLHISNTIDSKFSWLIKMGNNSFSTKSSIWDLRAVSEDRRLREAEDFTDEPVFAFPFVLYVLLCSPG